MKFHINLSRTCYLSLCLAWIACVSQAYAQTESDAETAPSRISGFATLGMVYNTNPDAGLVFSGAQTKAAYQGLSANLDSVLGLQWDYKFSPATSLKVQGVLRAGEEFQPKLRMAYVQQALAEELSMRIGRMRSPLFFDADTTEIGYANTAIRGPIPLYAGTSASQIIHIDGLNVHWRKPLDAFSLTVDGYWGGGQFTHYDVTKVPTAESQINTNGISNLAVSLAFGDGLIRFSHARLANYSVVSDSLNQLNQGMADLSAGLNKSANSFAAFGQAALAQALTDKAKLLDAYINPFNGAQTYDSIGFSTTVADFGVAGEWAWLNSDAVMLGKREAYQISVNYKAGNFTPFIAYSSARRVGNWADANPLTPTGVTSLAQLDAGITRISQGLDLTSKLSNITMQGLSLGMRWEIASNMAAKFQYDLLTTPNGNVPGAFKVRSFPFDNTAHLLSASLDAVF
jgi:hypothetical protein